MEALKPAGSGSGATLKASVRRLLPALDVVLAPLVAPAAVLLRLVRTAGLHRLPLCRRVLVGIGLLPIRRHYYEPLFDPRDLRSSLDGDRPLPGIDLRIGEQLSLLRELRTAGAEIADLTATATATTDLSFHFGNVAFESGDAEIWYALIRHLRPRTIIEIGSGHSTKLAARAIERNRRDDASYRCRHVCIEPYEMPWLEKLGVEVVRRRVEEVGADFFASLAAGDILFIDSSHIIRPQGDVLFEFLELLPTLSPGVVVHVHDVFTPRDYLQPWVTEQVRLWNEQYLLEAFLTDNARWEVVLALNHLHHHHYDDLAKACPFLTPDREPGSFYIRRGGA